MYGQKLYRGFESPPLRQTVWVEERIRRVEADSRKIASILRGLALDLDKREWRWDVLAPMFQQFSPETRSAVQLHNVSWAKTRRSRAELAGTDNRVPIVIEGSSETFLPPK